MTERCDVRGPLVLAGSQGGPLAASIATALGVTLGEVDLRRFPDQELRVALRSEVAGRDVYVVQSLAPPAEQGLWELTLLGDALVRCGAARLTAVVPYLAYARQDRRVKGQEALGAAAVAKLVEAAGFHRILCVDLHNPAIEVGFRIPVLHLSATDVLAQALRPSVVEGSVVISPDLGGVKRARAFADALGLPMVALEKTRLSGTDVEVRAVVGELGTWAPLIVDDMVSTAGTLAAAVRALRDAGCAEEVVIAVTHGLFVGEALARLEGLPIRRLLVTDTLPLTRAPAGTEVVSVAPLIAEAIRRA